MLDFGKAPVEILHTEGDSPPLRGFPLDFDWDDTEWVSEAWFGISEKQCGEVDGDESGSEGDPQNPNLSQRGWCEHTNRGRSSAGMVCIDCGTIINDLDYSFDRNEGNNRCQHQAVYTRSVDDVFLKNNISEENFVLDEVDKIYRTVAKKKKVRSTSRDALVAICYRFYLLKKGDCRPLTDLVKQFGVTRKYLSAALAKYYKAFPADRTIHLRPKDLVKRALILENFDQEFIQEHCPRIERMCELAYNRSADLDHRNPQSVASAMVYVYIKYRLPHLTLNRKVFAKNVELSEMTIDKISKEIERLFTPQRG